MERYVDLHVHTTASDGTDTPGQVAALARSLDLAAVAVTDHDTAAGLAEALDAGARLGIEVVPGVELAADYGGDEVHILGLFIRPDAGPLREALAWAAARREARNGEIVAAMAADGIPISLPALRAADPGAVLGRPHIARWLVEHGYVSSVAEGFDRYLDRGQKYYRPRRLLSLAEAAGCIRAAGGVAVIAHPYQYGFEGGAWEAFIKAGALAGCRAVEAYYPGYSPAQTAALMDAAARYGLAPSGGSDYHGGRKPDIRLGTGRDGDLAVPAGVLEGLRRQL